jgi:hypothetical protein
MQQQNNNFKMEISQVKVIKWNFFDNRSVFQIFTHLLSMVLVVGTMQLFCIFTEIYNR